jgi:hypothetical protein
VVRHFGYDLRPHRGDRNPRRHDFPIRGAYSYFEPSHFDGPRFSRRASRPTRSNGEVQRIMRTFLGHKIFLTNSSTEPSTFSHSM